ncbi:MAG: Eco57I restriction-modification methylase domain-containing protein [Culicoidibacterales bacterium]
MLSTEEIKKTGSVYTPIQLGEYMARKMFKDYTEKFETTSTYKILDPSCGTGDLLCAAINVARELNINIEVIGFDLNKQAVEKAKEKIADLGVNATFYQQDFLEFALQNEYNRNSLFCEEYSTFDFIIANPPYIRTQVLGAEYSKKLAQYFGIKGKIDIYQAFYAAFPSIMHSKSIMCTITSNKFLTNKTGKDLRKILKNRFWLTEIVDLGDTKVFDAAVLPAIVVGKISKKEQETTKFYSLYETTPSERVKITNYENIFDAIDKEQIGIFQLSGKTYIGKKGIVVFPIADNEPWSLASTNEYKWAKSVELSFGRKIKDYGKVRVGIKTTADNVFLNQEFDGYNIEKELLHPLLNSKFANRWKIESSVESLPKILYPMVQGKGKRKAEPIDLDEYEGAKEYLESYFEQLDSRQYLKKAKRKWFEIWVPQDPSLWKEPKIVWPDISENPRFSYDDQGLYIDGNCYWLVLDKNSQDMLFLILGVANSHTIKKYHEIRFQNKLYSNKYRYLTQYVEEYPIPDINLPESQQIIQIVEDLVRIGKDIEKENEIDLLLKKIIDSKKR